LWGRTKTHEMELGGGLAANMGMQHRQAWGRKIKEKEGKA